MPSTFGGQDTKTSGAKTEGSGRGKERDPPPHTPLEHEIHNFTGSGVWVPITSNFVRFFKIKPKYLFKMLHYILKSGHAVIKDMADRRRFDGALETEFNVHIRISFVLVVV